VTEPRDELQAIERAAAELVPDLAERLARHGLGEIEIRRGDLRVRVAVNGSGIVATPAMTTTPGGRSAASVRSAAAPVLGSSPGVGHVTAAAALALGPQEVTAPAVGYFVFGEGLGPGLEVQKGDLLGHVEVLGVAHDVLAPRSGSVRNLVAETGEAVEYGQVLIELEVPA
jgi:acetyl-CoA carboxylase biotin carboxyl carrier protein